MRLWGAGAGLAVSLAVAGPALAQDVGIGPELAAYLEVSGGGAFPISGQLGAEPFGFVTVAGRASMNLRGPWDLQLDAQSLTTFSNGQSATFAGGIAHFYRRSGDWAAGVLGGGLFGEGIRVGVVGAEAVRFGDNAILTGQILYAPYTTGGGFRSNAVQGRLGVSYFLTENTAIFGEVLDTYYWFDGGSFNNVSGIVGLKHHYASLPITTFAQLRVEHLTGGMVPATVGIGVAGVTFHIGGNQGTLRQAGEAVPMLVRFPPAL